MDEYLLQNGQSKETRAAAIQAVGGMPGSWLRRIAAAWLRWRGLQVFYRGQRRLAANADFLSSIASGERAYRNETGITASVRLANDLMTHGISPCQMTAKWDAEPVTLFGLPPELQGEVIGGAGIPFSTNLPVAAAYAQERGNGSTLRCSGSRIWMLRTGGDMSGNRSGSPSIKSVGC